MTSDHNIELGMEELSAYFLSPSEGNYHLKSTSPAIDAGSADDAPSIDIEGTLRPQGAAWDVGAYEFSVGDGIISPNICPVYILLLGWSGK